MQEHAWAEGYVVDIGYTHGFYRELTPALLRFATLLGEVPAADVEQPFTYYELGCGNGYSTALLAAANPQGRFIGVDFNPTHIHHARRRAQDGGVENVEFLEKSFAELLGLDLPDAEVIALHGVYSWVSAENRRHIVEFIRRRLKPGGIAYVSYNCLPGQAQVAPLQRLLLEHANSGTGPLAERIARSVEFAHRFEQAGANFFRINPFAKQRLGGLGKQDPSYLAHEYYNDNWAPFYHADVAADMAGAKLVYAASATLLENFNQFMLTPPMAQLVAEAGDRALAETIKDFACNKVFRKDVFTRGAPKAAAQELEALLGRTRFALARPHSACRLTGATPVGEINLQAQVHMPVLDALARAAMTFDDLVQATQAQGMTRQQVRQAVFGLAALGNVLPALPAAGEDARRVATARFNKAVLSQPIGGNDTMLASPLWGSGVHLNLFDRVFLAGPRKPGDAIEQALKTLLSHGHKVMRDNKPVESTEELRGMIEERAAYFFGDVMPFLRQIGIAE
jgi:SAM-dependent methyltransferase